MERAGIRATVARETFYPFTRPAFTPSSDSIVLLASLEMFSAIHETSLSAVQDFMVAVSDHLER